jgi:hypothetical protein
MIFSGELEDSPRIRANDFNGNPDVAVLLR